MIVRILLLLIVMSAPIGAQAEFNVGIAENYVALNPNVMDDLRELYKRTGIDDVNFHVMPGSRLMSVAPSGVFDAIDARFKSAMSEFDLIPVGVPLYLEVKHYAWGMKNQNIQINTLDDLNNYRVIGNRGFQYAINLAEHYNVELVNSSVVALKMLEAGRSDLVLLSSYELQKIAETTGASFDFLEMKSDVVASSWLYHFVHPRHADKVELLEKNIRTLQQEGRFIVN